MTMTKRDYYENLLGIVEGRDSINVMDEMTGETYDAKGEFVDFLNHEIEMLDSKAVKAKERREAKRAEGDAIQSQIAELLTDDFQTIDDLTDAYNDAYDDTITRNRVAARLKNLIENETAVKDAIKVDGRKLMAYRRA